MLRRQPRFNHYIVNMEKGIFNSLYKYLIASQEQARQQQTASPAWLADKRNAAFSVFSAKGFPSRKNEEWRFTNLERFLSADFTFQAEVVPDQVPAALDGLEASRIVMINGRFAAELSDPLPDGLTFLDTEDALKDERFIAKFETIAADSENAMLALNTAFFRECSFLHVEAKAIVEKPLHIAHYYTSHAEAAFIPYRILVLAEKMSEATLIETFHSDAGAPVFVSYVSEQFIAEAAVFHSHILNDLHDNIHFIQHREVIQEANSVLNNSNIAMGDTALVRNDINFRLTASGTETNLIGAYLLTGDQHVDNHTLVDHMMPHCNSSELYKGILTDRSRAVFNGKVFVRQDAQKTNAFQQNNNLLLSNEATVNSKPQLEIFADDVKCSHGSTVGQMNKEALFYLKARGIGDETASRLLMEAFLVDVISRIEVDALREYAERLLNKKMAIPSLIGDGESLAESSL